MKMSLADRLRAVDKSKPKPKPEAADAPPLTCRHLFHLHPMSEFPHAFEATRETLQLMEAETLPDHFGPKDILYLDTETTGFVSSGTVAFLVGVGFLTEEGFEVHQYLMRDYPEEPALLQEIEKLLQRFPVICTFNGRTFDIPLLKTRYTMNRMRSTSLDKPHIDLIHIARRVFKMRLGRCSLSRLEEAVLGQPREDDLPGSEAPKRYFDYIHTHDDTLLDPVIAHNEQDIASLCTLLSRMCHMYDQPDVVRHDQDILSMGISLEKRRHEREAQRCYRLVPAGRMHAAAQLRLARSLRRSGETGETVRIHEEMIRRREGGIDPYVELAKYYEHQRRDYDTALRYTMQALNLWRSVYVPLGANNATETERMLKHRAARLQRLQQQREGK